MTHNSSIWILSGFTILFLSCVQLNPESSNSTKVNHAIWDSLLHTHVDHLGYVNYQGFIKDSTTLNNYLNQLANNAPNSNWNKQDQLAYWINLYNASTIKLITKHYPVKSIKDIGASLQIPFVNTPWQIEFIKIGGKFYNLDNIEHNIIRKNFEEPRIHFALVCAAASCPKLRNEAFLGHKLEEQLTDQAIQFLSDTTKNSIKKNNLVISKLFRWYGGDFKKHTTLIEFLNLYSPVDIGTATEINYMDYNWTLNEQKSNNAN